MVDHNDRSHRCSRVDLLHGPLCLTGVLCSGSGACGRCVLLRCRATGAEIAVKYMQRGPHIDKKTVREIVNHRMLNHPNVVRFLEVMEKHASMQVVWSGGCPTNLHGQLPRNPTRPWFLHPRYS
jgi:hypothetical protein